MRCLLSYIVAILQTVKICTFEWLSSKPNAGLMQGQCRRRWPSIEPTMGQHLVFSGKLIVNVFPMDAWGYKIFC